MFQFPANPAVGDQFNPAIGVTYEWNGTGWLFLGQTIASLLPPGLLMPYAGPEPIPFQGWLICNGASYPVDTYPALFAVLGYSYGGSGPNFSVPDLRGRVIAGVDSMGGTAAGRLGAIMSGALAAAGGSEQVTLTTTALPAHAHGITDIAHGHGISASHNHGITDVAHGHGITDNQHKHGYSDPGHTHGGSSNQGYGLSTTPNTGDAGFAPRADRAIVTIGGGGDSSQTHIDIAYSATGISINGSGTGLSATNHGGDGIAVHAGGTGLSTTNNAGSGGGHSNVQPTACLNFLIKT